MRRLWSLAVVLALLVTTASAWAKDVVVVYTALEPEQITDYMKAVNKSLPNIEVKMLRLSTGDISARFMPHTSFTDPTTPPGAPMRESIELRTLVFHPA